MIDNTKDNATSATTPSGGSWKGLKIAAAIVVVVLIAIWIGLWLQHRLTHVTASDARVATNEITVSSRLPGKLVQFDVMQGDHLQAGELVAQLYSKPATLKLEQFQAQVARIEAQIAVEKKRMHLAQLHMAGGIDQLEAMLQADMAAAQAARAQMKEAHNRAERMAKLFEVHGATEQQRDTAAFNYQAAQARYQQAQSRVAADKVALANAKTGMLSARLGAVPNPAVLRKKLTVTKSQLKKAKARVAHQKNRIGDLGVHSPIDGVVDRAFVDEGEYISPGQPILMMHNPDNVWVEAKIKETDIAELEVGQPVAIHVDAYPDIEYRGHVRVIGHAATSQFALLPNPNPSGNFTKITQRIPVRIAIDHGPRSKLAPGMMVVVDIQVVDEDQQASPAQ